MKMAWLEVLTVGKKQIESVDLFAFRRAGKV